jgi:acyl carrier protein
MEDIRTAIRHILRVILERRTGVVHTLVAADETSLYESSNGLGLDSLETAELSVLLEHHFGEDPYSNGQIVQTFGELVAYYQGKGQ